MKRERFTSRRWPSLEQTLILRAAIAPGPEAIDAWLASGETGNLQATHDDSLRLLPMVYRNLVRAGFDGPGLEHLKGTYRRTWYHNQLLLRSAMPILLELQVREVPFLLMKGAPLLFEIYGDSGARSLGDFDVLVDPADGPRAADVLREAGWSPPIRIRQPEARTFELVHAVEFNRGPAAGVDLHAHALEECCYPGADAGFWSRARSMPLQDIEVRTLSYEDMLLHVCVHGSRGAPSRVVHWVADAVAIIRKAGQLDWAALVAEARDRRVSIGLGNSLAYLASTWDVQVPAHVLSRLLDGHHAVVERLDWRIQERAPAVVPMALRDVLRYTRLSRDRPLPGRLTGFPEYLQALWGFDRASEIPREAFRRAKSRAVANRSQPPG